MSSRQLPSIGDRLLPTLLDRLIDEDPSKRSEAAYSRAMHKTVYRQSVLRDLRWLFNSINSESEIDYNSHDQARRSVINFGLPPLAGKQLSELDWPAIEGMIRAAVIQFEPRVLPESIQVRAIVAGSSGHQHNLLAFEIKGQLWSEPYPIELLLRSQIDLESGNVSVTDNSGMTA